MLDIFYRWLIGDMGTPGNYENQAIHWYSLAAVIAVFLITFAAAFILRHNEKKRKVLLQITAVFHLIFEIVWRLVYVFVKGDTISCWWPLYPCNLGGVLLPIIALTNWQTGKKLFYLFGFVGGVLTFAIPQDIFTSDVLVFPILKSILQHTGLLLIPMLEYVYGTYRPTLKDMGCVFAGCLVHVVNCEVIDRLLGFTEDYMFFRSDMPFVIPGVPQWITLSVFGLTVFAILTFLCDIKGSIHFLRQIFSAKKNTENGLSV